MKKNVKVISSALAILAMALFPLLAGAQNGYEISSFEGRFSITFPDKPDYSVEDIETDVGMLKMHTYIYEGSDDVAFLLAYIDYPQDLVEESDADDLLEAAMEGAVGSWGFDMNSLKKETRWHNGNKGLYAKGSTDDTHTAYEVILAGNRLYQLAILQYNSPIDENELNTFFTSFKISD
jgi:hypothetical protein